MNRDALDQPRANLLADLNAQADDDTRIALLGQWTPAVRDEYRVEMPQGGNVVPANGIVPQAEQAVFDWDYMVSIVQALINGDTDIPDETTRVEWLSVDQRLALPHLLAEQLTQAQATALAALLALAPEEQDAAAMRYARANGICVDIRDIGWLNNADNRCADNAWAEANINGVGADRLRCRLHSTTMLTIAALNAGKLGGEPYVLYGWARAFAVGCRFLPAANTALTREFYFTPDKPRRLMVTACSSMMKGDTEGHARRVSIHSWSLNLLAMFGLMHLHYDHTVRTGDARMERAGEAWLKTLRTLAIPVDASRVMEDKVMALRTAMHPFGLGASYACARIMAQNNKLSIALIPRLDTSPPPVQRLMIVRAAFNQMQGLPLGAYLNGMYRQQLGRIAVECDRIVRNAPAYSHLYRLYGLTDDERQKIDEDLMQIATSLMPLAYGYAMAFCVDQDRSGFDAKFGLALAASFDNIRRDFGGVAQMWRSMFEGYYGDAIDKGIEEFVAKMVRVQQVVATTEVGAGSSAPAIAP